MIYYLRQKHWSFTLLLFKCFPNFLAHDLHRIKKEVFIVSFFWGGGGGVAIQSVVQQLKIYSNKWGHLAKGPSIAARGRRRVLHFSEAGFEITTYAIHSRVHFAEVLRCFFFYFCV